MTDYHRSLDHALTSTRSRTTAILASHQLAFTTWGGGMHFCQDVGGGRCGWSSNGPLALAEQSHRAHVEAALEAAGVGAS
jgi:hypothetical protein